MKKEGWAKEGKGRVGSKMATGRLLAEVQSIPGVKSEGCAGDFTGGSRVRAWPSDRRQQFLGFLWIFFSFFFLEVVILKEMMWG